MDLPTYDDLHIRWNVGGALMKETFINDHLIDLASSLDTIRWEMFAIHLRIPSSEIESIKMQRDVSVQTIRMLECWKQRNGSEAIYEVLAKAFTEPT